MQDGVVNRDVGRMKVSFAIVDDGGGSPGGGSGDAGDNSVENVLRV